MIYLLLAILSSTCVSSFMRLSEKYISNKMMMFVANYALCTIFSYLYIDNSITYSLDYGFIVMLITGAITGILYLVSFMALKTNMQYNGVVLSSTFMRLGVLIPTAIAIIIFKEVPKFSQIIGFIIAILAIILINFDKEGIKEGSKKTWLLGLLVLNGLGDSMANIFDKLGNPSYGDGYLIMTFLVALLLSIVLTLKDKQTINRYDILFGILVGVPNYYSARFLLLALNSMNAVIVYPVYSIATMIAITSVGVLCFKEKLNRQKLIALLMIMVALTLLNI